MVNTVVFNDGDHAEYRPVVIVRAPKRETDYLVVIQRSSTCFYLPGVEHPASPSLGLDQRGKWVFRFQRSVRGAEFLGHSPELRGTLGEDEIEALVTAWENSP